MWLSVFASCFSPTSPFSIMKSNVGDLLAFCLRIGLDGAQRWREIQTHHPVKLSGCFCQ
jgi:hypothetical protein